MKRAKMNFICPVCEDKFEVEFSKPNYFTPSFSGGKCKTCDAGFRIKFSYVKGQTKKVHIEPTLNWISPKTVEYLKKKEKKDGTKTEEEAKSTRTNSPTI
jgi:hypothetical protein